MEAMLRDIPGTQVFLDDVLVAEDQNDLGENLAKGASGF